jgi:small conductance mechanosensitive channel
VNLLALLDQLVSDCGPDTLCGRVSEATGREWVGQVLAFVVAKPLKIVLILIGAIIVRALLKRSISRLAARAAEGSVPGVLAKGPSLFLEDSPLLSERRKQRAATMASVLASVVTGVVLTVAFVMILSELGLNIAPLIASAGIVGVAIGFGAQTLVKDFLSGLFMILEDQYGVGDTVDLGETMGTVEAVGLRITRVRGFDGVVWYVRNGEILRVGNRSQGWSTAIIDVAVAHGQDLARIQELVLETAHALAEDPDWQDKLVGEPELAGVEAVANDSVTVRLILKCAPNEHLPVQRELRRRLLAGFAAEGIRLPPPPLLNRPPA